jgi:pimeloyl-ACP methyl ester carboxylesterase
VSSSRWYGLKRLVFDTLDQTTAFVESTHLGVADRTLRRLDLIPPLGGAARAVAPLHRLGMRLVYATIRGVGRGIDVATELPLRAALERSGPDPAPAAGAVPLDSDAFGSAAWVADSAQAALTGFFGDRLAQRGNPLAEAMSLRHQGRAIDPTLASLQQAFPQATGRLVILIHGLACTEWCWSYQAREVWGDPLLNYGTALARDLGFTPVFVRYNTGRHISKNGQDLARLLTELCAAWPTPVHELTLLGHSMGGLVARSAADARQSPGRLRGAPPGLLRERLAPRRERPLTSPSAAQLQLCTQAGIPLHCWHRPVGQQIPKQALVPAAQQTPQSPGHELQVSPLLQVPSPQTGQAPQSWAQVPQLSPLPPSQTPSPQTAQVPQSCWQLLQLSPSQDSHWKLPQHWPQSPGQVAQDSLPLHWPSPQTGQAPQSWAQEPQLSPSQDSHWPLPQH